MAYVDSSRTWSCWLYGSGAVTPADTTMGTCQRLSRSVQRACAQATLPGGRMPTPLPAHAPAADAAWPAARAARPRG